MRLTFPHNGYYLAKEKYLEACLEAKARTRATWSTPTLNIQTWSFTTTCPWDFSTDAFRGLNIRALHLRMISSTVEYMSCLERASNTRDGANKAFQPAKLKEVH